MNGVLRVLSATAALLPVVVAAQETQQARPSEPQFEYTYVEIGYDETEFEVGGAGEIDGDGLTISGSFELNNEWHVFASYGQADLDFGFDLDTLAVGAGYVYPLKDGIDLYGRVLYIDMEVDGPGSQGGDDDGLGLQFRIRGRVSDELELEGGIQYVDVADSDTSLQAGARYYFSDSFSAGIGLTFGGDADAIGINARFEF
jgi:hypothetical protein